MLVLEASVLCFFQLTFIGICIWDVPSTDFPSKFCSSDPSLVALYLLSCFTLLTLTVALFMHDTLLCAPVLVILITFGFSACRMVGSLLSSSSRHFTIWSFNLQPSNSAFADAFMSHCIIGQLFLDFLCAPCWLISAMLVTSCIVSLSCHASGTNFYDFMWLIAQLWPCCHHSSRSPSNLLPLRQWSASAQLPDAIPCTGFWITSFVWANNFHIDLYFSRESCPSLFSHSRLWESFLYTVTFIIWNAICLMLATVNDSDYVIGRHCLCATPIVQHRDPLIAMTTCPSWFCADPSRRFIYITIYACLVSVSSWYTLTWLWEGHIWVNHQWSLATSAFDLHYGRMLISPFVLVWYVPLSEFPLLPTSECTTLVVGIDTYQALSVHPYCFL